MNKQSLAHPLAKGIDLDSPKGVQRRLQIIQKKGFLQCVYQDWYRAISVEVSGIYSPVLEIGSGAGFFGDYFPEVISSDLLWCQNLSIVLDGQALPFKDNALGAVVMINVLHHLPNVSEFFLEASRCIKSKGKIIMIEPWLTLWSNFVYSFLHHEPCNPRAAEWEFSPSGPLSGANVALPWIVFERDEKDFKEKFPDWSIQLVRTMMPLCYLLSGGVSIRSLMPAWTYSFWRFIDKCLLKMDEAFAMFALIVLKKGDPIFADNKLEKLSDNERKIDYPKSTRN
jgi:SAM-dependent methyltransferase